MRTLKIPKRKVTKQKGEFDVEVDGKTSKVYGKKKTVTRGGKTKVKFKAKGVGDSPVKKIKNKTITKGGLVKKSKKTTKYKGGEKKAESYGTIAGKAMAKIAAKSGDPYYPPKVPEEQVAEPKTAQEMTFNSPSRKGLNEQSDAEEKAKARRHYYRGTSEIPEEQAQELSKRKEFEKPSVRQKRKREERLDKSGRIKKRMDKLATKSKKAEGKGKYRSAARKDMRLAKLSSKLHKKAEESKKKDPYTYFKETKSGKAKPISQRRGQGLEKRYGKKGTVSMNEVTDAVKKTTHKKGKKAVIKAKIGDPYKPNKKKKKNS